MKKTAEHPASPTAVAGTIYALAEKAKNRARKTKKLKIQKKALGRKIRELTTSEKKSKKENPRIQKLKKRKKILDKEIRRLIQSTEKEKKEVLKLLKHAKA